MKIEFSIDASAIEDQASRDSMIANDMIVTRTANVIFDQLQKTMSIDFHEFKDFAADVVDPLSRLVNCQLSWNIVEDTEPIAVRRGDEVSATLYDGTPVRGTVIGPGTEADHVLIRIHWMLHPSPYQEVGGVKECELSNMFLLPWNVKVFGYDYA